MRGPRVSAAFDADGKPTKAGEGFARGRGLKPGQLERETFDGDEFVVAVVEAERRPAPEVLPAVATAILTGLQIPRGMRWGARPATADEYFRFSRPVRWLVCLYGDEVVPFAFYDLVAGAVSQGHRVLGAPLVVDRADHYERHLAEQKVVVSQTRRTDLIVEGLGASASGLGGRWFDPGEVLGETTYLVEWPSVHVGRFDSRHLRLPREVLITAMQSHQRYFPVKDQGERLLPQFLYVSNADPGAAVEITHGNERVLEGRLDDAEFSYDRDLAEGLEAMASRLARSSSTPGWARWPTRPAAWRR